eukprot:CAMPEP_0172751160 /NCGR_PEP_ID=MMETSP1074-20121228/151022_1 /TAXON_ID=2916 /ORGANISM="Ceratium fusus, Strain PA161109" /LENGTH=258 /DNA_ID=CAMNT_0013583421 /DNA_START=63 /DNA_END=836 /DNA_ORIENTATION=+
MAPRMTEENVQDVVALVVTLKEALEDADEVELWTQLTELQDQMTSVLSNAENDASALRAKADTVKRLNEIYFQLSAIAEEPSNSVQFLHLCKHLREVLPQLGIGQELPTEKNYEVQVHMLGLLDLSLPEYRFGDGIRKIVQGPETCLQSVFIEVELDGQRCKTAQQSVNKERCITTCNEEMLFSCCRQSQLTLSVYDHRQIQSSLRGHPLIGQAMLTLADIQIGESTQKELVITRHGEETGRVSLQLYLAQLGTATTL